jgi:predicted nuclease of predicted toxin-antitoxin system
VKILLDECVNQRLARDFIEHEVSTVEQMGWKSKANGELLALAAKAFDVFVTTDRNLSFQQNVQNLSIAVVVMRACTNRLADLRPIVPAVLKVLPFLKKGEVREIGV